MAAKTAGWVWPVNNKRITQGFTTTHHAVDIGVPTGTKIVAPAKGKIIYAGWNNQGYGNLVEIQTSTGEKVLLGHMQSVGVKVGQSVDAGQSVGISDSTGNSTGPHLHYEIRTAGGGGYINPLGGSVGVSTNAAANAKNISTAGQPSGNKPPNVSTTTGKPGGTPPINPKTGNIETGTSEVAAQGAQLDFISQIVSNIITQIKDQFSFSWGNVAAAIAGIVLISIGVFGLVLGESLRPAAEQVGEAIKETAK